MGLLIKYQKVYVKLIAGIMIAAFSMNTSCGTRDPRDTKTVVSQVTCGGLVGHMSGTTNTDTLNLYLQTIYNTLVCGVVVYKH